MHSMKRGGKQMKGEAPNMSSKEMAQIRQNLEGTPDIEEAAELMNLAGNPTRLKLLYLLENMKELCVCDLAEMLGVSVSAVSQHLAKLKAYGLVAPRRDAQTIYYRLTDHAGEQQAGHGVDGGEALPQAQAVGPQRPLLRPLDPTEDQGGGEHPRRHPDRRQHVQRPRPDHARSSSARTLSSKPRGVAPFGPRTCDWLPPARRSRPAGPNGVTRPVRGLRMPAGESHDEEEGEPCTHAPSSPISGT